MSDEFDWYEIKVCVAPDATVGMNMKVLDAIDEAVTRVTGFSGFLNDGTIWMESGPSDHNTEAAFDRIVQEVEELRKDNDSLRKQIQSLEDTAWFL